MLVAAVVTAVSLPFLVWSGRTANPSAVATVDGGDVTAGLRGNGSSSSVDKSSSPDIGYLNGPETTLEAAPILIGVPAAKPLNEIDGKVGYREVPPAWRNNPRPCIANKLVPPGSQLPDGTRLTITNLSNSHTTTCNVVVHYPMPADQILQLTESVFNELGDQIDSPLSVRISWK
jgi:hypothetical protein